MNTDIQKTLELLRQAGPRGIHSFELNKLVGTDRAAARVRDLKEMGHAISRVTEKMNGSVGCRYFLVSEIEKPIERPIRYIFKGNTAIPVTV